MTTLSLSATRLAVLGDVHLCRPGHPMSCRAPAEELTALAEHLRATHDVIVLNGDLFDLDRGPVPLRFRHELEVVEAAHADTVRALLRDGVVLLHGNHDRVLGELGRAAAAADVQVGPWRVRVEHGDRFDAPIKQLRRFASLVTWTSGRVSQPPLRPIYRAMRFLESALTGEREGDSGIERRARAWLADADVDALIIGHTHAEHVSEADGRMLINPGACLDVPLRWVSIDADAGVVSLNRFENGGARETRRATLASPARSGP